MNTLGRWCVYICLSNPYLLAAGAFVFACLTQPIGRKCFCISDQFFCTMQPTTQVNIGVVSSVSPSFSVATPKSDADYRSPKVVQCSETIDT